MPEGAGKYDEECTIVRNRTEGSVVLVAVIDGNKGSGFSVQCLEDTTLLVLADILESMAKSIRTDPLLAGKNDTRTETRKRNPDKSGKVA